MVASKCGEESVAIDRVKLLKTGGGTLLSAFVTLSSEEEAPGFPPLARHCTARLNGARYAGQVLAASVARNREGSQGPRKAKDGDGGTGGRNRAVGVGESSTAPEVAESKQAFLQDLPTSTDKKGSLEVRPANLHMRRARWVAGAYRPAASLLQERWD
ncbi:unnamed protein product [Durusdinium trenchii]|uniref:Uncharacterized protein n=1 Tax=Durusdinium trenchii TaxID=1381693 RepID=A0ABP0SVS2_9DINO